MLFPKPPKKVRSAPVRQSARDKRCTLRMPWCSGEGVVLAHLRRTGNAGIAQKPHDTLAVFACGPCHDALDGRGRYPAVPAEDILRALGETHDALIAEGLIVVKGDKG